MRKINIDGIEHELTINDDLIKQLSSHDLCFISEFTYKCVSELYHIDEIDNFSHEERWNFIKRAFERFLEKNEDNE